MTKSKKLQDEIKSLIKKIKEEEQENLKNLSENEEKEFVTKIQKIQFLKDYNKKKIELSKVWFSYWEGVYSAYLLNLKGPDAFSVSSSYRASQLDLSTLKTLVKKIGALYQESPEIWQENLKFLTDYWAIVQLKKESGEKITLYPNFEE